MITIGGVVKAVKKVVSAPFKVVGSLLGAGGQTVNVSAPDVSGAQIQASTAAQAPEAPLLGTENTTLDKKKKKRGKSGLLIQKDSSGTNKSGGGNYSGLNI